MVEQTAVIFYSLKIEHSAQPIKVKSVISPRIGIEIKGSIEIRLEIQTNKVTNVINITTRIVSRPILHLARHEPIMRLTLAKDKPTTKENNAKRETKVNSG